MVWRVKEGKKQYTGNILNEIEPRLNLKFNFISNLMCNTNSKTSLTIDFSIIISLKQRYSRKFKNTLHQSIMNMIARNWSQFYYSLKKFNIQ